MAVNSYVNRLHDVYSSTNYVYNSNRCQNISDSKTVGFLEIPIKDDFDFIPLIVRGVLRDRLEVLNNLNEQPPEKTIYPIIIDSNSTVELKTVGELMHYWFNPKESLRLYSLNKNKYYVGRGIILDEDLNIILLGTSNFPILPLNRMNSSIEQKYSLVVNPSVLTKSTILNKHIVKYIIPHFTTYLEKIGFWYGNVVIKDLNYMVVKMNNAYNDTPHLDAQRILHTHLNEIINIL